MDLFWGEDGRLRSGWRFLLSVFVFVFINGFAVDLANALAGPSDRKFELFYRPLMMLLLVVAFSGMLKILDRVEGNPLPAMGLVRTSFLRDTLVGLGMGSGMVLLSLLPIAIAYHLGFHAVLSRHSLKMGCAVLVILATGAMAEEVAFRGYPFQRLIDAVGAAAAIAFSSALFGFVHLRNPHSSAFSLINTVAIGIVLAIAYLRTRALWLPWGLHFAWNLTLGGLFGLPVSGISQFAVVIRGTASGPEWLTGGTYGIEGGAAGTLGILMGLGLVVFGVRSRSRPAPPQYQEEEGLTSSDCGGIQLSQGTGVPGAINPKD